MKTRQDTKLWPENLSAKRAITRLENNITMEGEDMVREGVD
jgi:hypothetical protein